MELKKKIVILTLFECEWRKEKEIKFKKLK